MLRRLTIEVGKKGTRESGYEKVRQVDGRWCGEEGGNVDLPELTQNVAYLHHYLFILFFNHITFVV